MLTVHLSFKLVRFATELAFQILEIDTTFWTSVGTVVPTGSYVASNGITVTVGSASDISTISSNSITISNTTPGDYNLSTVDATTSILRDTYFEKIVAALKEFVLYVLAGGTLPHTCHQCFNFNNYTDPDHFCKWVDEVPDAWDIDAQYCSQYNVLSSSQSHFEVYEF